MGDIMMNRPGRINAGGSPDRDTVSIAAGSLDPPTGLRVMGHVYVGQAGDYYEM